MKPCPKCKKMNNAYADTCKFCGYDIKWVPDDGSDYKAPPDFSAEESKFYDNNSTNKKESDINPDKSDLDNIYSQLEDIKERMTKGVNLFDVTMPFGRMVVLIIKLTFASIPAVIIMGFLTLIFWVFFGGLLFTVLLKGYGMQ